MQPYVVKAIVMNKFEQMIKERVSHHMSSNKPIASISAALQRALGDLGRDEFSDSKCDHTRDDFHFAFHWGEAGGIAASAGVFGIKALELCDDISDAWEENDAEFLQCIIEELRKRQEARATANPNPSASGLPALVEVLSEAVMACATGQGQRFALMSGFAAGLLFAIPEPYPMLADGKLADRVMQYYRATLGTSEVDSLVVDEFVSGVLEDRLQRFLGVRGGRGVTTREAVIGAYESNSAATMEYLRGLMAHCCGHGGLYEGSINKYGPSPEEINAIRWAQNFGLRKSRIKDPFASIPDGIRVRMMTRQYAIWAQAWDGDRDLPNPIEMCYWVVPGRLLDGEYPRNLDTPSSRDKLA